MCFVFHTNLLGDEFVHVGGPTAQDLFRAAQHNRLGGDLRQRLLQLLVLVRLRAELVRILC